MSFPPITKAKCPVCGHVFHWSEKDGLELAMSEETRKIDLALLKIMKHNEKIKKGNKR